MSSRPLLGTGVLVTRPSHQADGLCQLIEDQGGTVTRFPVIEVAPPSDTAPLDEVIGRIEQFSLAIFISANAVDEGMQAINQRRDGLPSSIEIAVIGPSTAHALRKWQLAPNICPAPPYNSESLLAEPTLRQVDGKRILIVRGEGGREQLANTLRERGAIVEYAIAYSRRQPQLDPAPLIREWRRGAIQVVTATSNEALINLLDMVGEEGRSLLLESPLVVVSERNAALAEELGFTHSAIVAQEASDAAMVAAIIAGERRQWKPV